MPLEVTFDSRSIHLDNRNIFQPFVSISKFNVLLYHARTGKVISAEFDQETNSFDMENVPNKAKEDGLYFITLTLPVRNPKRGRFNWNHAKRTPIYRVSPLNLYLIRLIYLLTCFIDCSVCLEAK